MSEYDVIIVGSGLGGLCCGSILSLKGYKVLVCEAHSYPGGVAHSFIKNGYKFESGPSLWSGLNSWPTTNPLGQILHLLNERVAIKKYKSWKVLVPEGNFDLEVGDHPFRQKIKEMRGSKALKEWDSFMGSIKPISEIIDQTPLLTTSPDNLNIFELTLSERGIFTAPFISDLPKLPPSTSR